ncbi:hypothetical protein LY76DRAFT_599621, partial [Colletotrichum caudatum]
MSDAIPPTSNPDSAHKAPDQASTHLSKSFHRYRKSQAFDLDSDPRPTTQKPNMSKPSKTKKGKDKAPDQASHSDQTRTPPTTTSQTPLKKHILTAHNYRA